MSKRPSGEQTSAGKHQEAPPQCFLQKQVSSSDAKVRHGSTTAHLQTRECKGDINATRAAYLKAQCPSQARYPNSLAPQCREHLPLLLGCGGNLGDELGLDPLNFTQLQLGEGDARDVPGLRIKLTTLCFPALQLNC